MATGSQRSLPTAAQLRLLQFQQALLVPVQKTPDPLTLPDPVLFDDDQRRLELRRRSLLLQADTLGEQLARAQTRLTQARLRLQVLRGLQASFPADDELTQALRKVWQNEANATLRKEAGPLASEAMEIAKLLAEVS